ncbi:MAG: DNA polymerase III subunit delta [Casimicrobiaceae bacterium]|nr:DNA polymerase III subunit delta [Casimicrobiaceae bacterium]
MKPLYLIHGEELLTKIEARDGLRARARKAGYSEREHHVVEANFDWGALRDEAASLSLFAERRIVEVTLAAGRVGTEAAEFIAWVAAQASADVLFIFDLPKLERAQTESAWYAAARRAGEVIEARLIEREALPAWIAERLKRQGLAASEEVVALLAERCEGNLLAARQEIEKLTLLIPEAERDRLTPEAVLAAVTDVARYDPAELSLAFLSGDLARYARVLEGLRAEGEQAARLSWQLSEDVHALAGVILARRDGVPLLQAFRSLRIWGKRQQALERALERIPAARIPELIHRCALLDGQSKGQMPGDAWLTLAGLAAFAHGVLDLPVDVSA